MGVSGLRVLLAGLAGAVTLLLWGMIWWMAIGMALEPVRSLPGPAEAALVDAMAAESLEPGGYFFPGFPIDDSPESQEAWAAKHRDGPLGMLLYRPQGTEPMDPVLFVRGFAINLGACLLACLVILPGARGGWSFGTRAGAVFAFGLVAALVSYGNLWNWMYAPTDFAWKMGLDIAGGWLLAGIAIASVLRPVRPRTTVPDVP